MAVAVVVVVATVVGETDVKPWPWLPLRPILLSPTVVVAVAVAVAFVIDRRCCLKRDDPDVICRCFLAIFRLSYLNV